MIPMWFITDDVNLTHLFKMVPASFLHFKVNIFLSHILCFGSKSLSPAHTRERGIEVYFLEREYVQILFWILL